jgi:hypothetical protein
MAVKFSAANYLFGRFLTDAQSSQVQKLADKYGDPIRGQMDKVEDQIALAQKDWGKNAALRQPPIGLPEMGRPFLSKLRLIKPAAKVPDGFLAMPAFNPAAAEMKEKAENFRKEVSRLFLVQQMSVPVTKSTPYRDEFSTVPEKAVVVTVRSSGKRYELTGAAQMASSVWGYTLSRGEGDGTFSIDRGQQSISARFAEDGTVKWASYQDIRISPSVLYGYYIFDNPFAKDPDTAGALALHSPMLTTTQHLMVLMGEAISSIIAIAAFGARNAAIDWGIVGGFFLLGLVTLYGTHANRIFENNRSRLKGWTDRR